MPKWYTNLSNEEKSFLNKNVCVNWYEVGVQVVVCQLIKKLMDVQKGK